MNDLIRRQDAIRLAEQGQIQGFEWQFKKLCTLPSAEPDVIRCKDCKHWMPYDWMFSEVWQSKNMEDYPEDEMGCDCCDMNMGADDYCSRAERRGDSDERLNKQTGGD